MDQDKIKELAQRIVADTGGAFTMALCYIGDKLGLFRSMASGEPVASKELAQKTNLNERYVREWLKAMVAAEYLDYDQESNRYFMSPEQAAVLVDEDSSTFLAGGFQFTIPSLLKLPKVVDAFRYGGGVPFSEFGSEIAEAIDRIHRPAFIHFLVQEWLAGAPGLSERLDTGISVLDVGCGIGRSSIAIGKAYPQSKVVGLDLDPYSIKRARELTAESGVDNVKFVESKLDQLTKDTKYDLILALDCIHDMVDPVKELKAIRDVLAEDGTFFWVEPSGSHNPIENRNPTGKMRASLSPFHCLTVSLAEGGVGLGTLIGEAGARKLAEEAGFSGFEKLPIENPMQQFFSLSR